MSTSPGCLMAAACPAPAGSRARGSPHTAAPQTLGPGAPCRHGSRAGWLGMSHQSWLTGRSLVPRLWHQRAEGPARLLHINCSISQYRNVRPQRLRSGDSFRSSHRCFGAAQPRTDSCSCSWARGSGCPAATRSCHSTRSCPVTASVTGCSTCAGAQQKLWVCCALRQVHCRKRHHLQRNSSCRCDHRTH